MPPKRAGTAAVGDDGKLTLQSLRKRTKAAATAESGSAQLRAIAQEIAKNPYGLLEKKEDHRTCARSDHVRKKNCSGDPFCLYGLGELKMGIWADEPEVFSTLGTDLRKSDRRSEAARRADPAELTSDFTQPLGLRNLGATCYLNALMQCLFHNKPFRFCVYNTDTKPWTDANMAGVMLELQKAFAHMQWGYKNVYDLTYFTKRLGLQTQEQQDPQEFNKLFLSKLEEMVKGTAAGKRKRDARAGPVCVTDVFRGQQKYVTRCLECFNESGTDSPFYELELPVEGSRSLQQSLEMYLAAESLTGENQYACSHCGHKTDAERAAVISEAPEVLLLQLMRYVYDRATWTKKKLKNEIEFQSTIELNGNQYHLAAILYHKGSTAYGGHYVAEILDWETDRWWLFDDEVVTSSAPPSATVPDIVVLDDAADNEVKEMLDDDDVVEVQPQDANDAGDDAEDFMSDPSQSKKRKQAASSSGSSSPRANGAAKQKRKRKKNKEGFNRLKDAYMFAYVLDSTIRKWRHEPIDAADEVKDVVRQANIDFLIEFGAYEKRRNELEEKLNQRKRLYDALFLGQKAIARVQDSTDFTLVPTKWLQQWVTGTVISESQGKQKAENSELSEPVVDLSNEARSSGEAKQAETIVIDDATTTATSTPSTASSRAPEPLPALFTSGIANLPYLCPHGEGLKPSLVGQFKAISNEAFQQIVRGSWPDSDDAFLGPVTVDFILDSAHYKCDQCVREAHNRSLEVAETTARYEKLLADIDNSTLGENISKDVKNVYLLASRWITDLKKHTEQLVRHTKKAAEMMTQGKTDKQTLLNFFATPTESNGGASISGAPEEKPKLTPIDERVNTALLCPHGLLAPKGRQKRHRTITKDGWECVTRLFPNAIPLLNSSDCCPTCQQEEEHEIAFRRQLRDEKSMDFQEKSLVNLTKDRLYPLLFERPDFVQAPHTVASAADTRFYLIDKGWLSSWRHYHSDAQAPTPGQITNSRLRCPHGLTLVPPGLMSLLVVGQWDDATVSGVPESELITGAQWHALMQLYGPQGMKIVGEQEDRHSGDFGDDGAGEEKAVEPAFEALLMHNGQEWVWDPLPCDECIHQACSKAEAERTAFTDGVIKICKLRRGQEPPMGGARANGTQRRTRGAGSFTPVAASANDTLALFKLKIFQELGVEPNRQRLFYNSQELLDPTRSLAQLGIRAEDQVYLQEKGSDEVDEDGVADMWTYSHVGANETGFRGTLLSGGPPAAAQGEEHQNGTAHEAQASQSVQVEIPRELIAQLTGMGFDEAAAVAALDATGSNMDRAVEMLLKSAS